MSDTQPPVLTGLVLPDHIDLGNGDAIISYSAAADDNVGVSSIWITFDRPIVGAAGPTSTWLMREEFGEDFTQEAISRDLVVSRSNAPGPVVVTGVTVYDDAGNAASYTTADLHAMGLPTGFTLLEGQPDTTPPVLTGLTLPGEIDLTGLDRPADATFAVGAADDAGIDGIWLTFERPASGSNPAANRWLVYAEGAEDWATGEISRSVPISVETVPGEVMLHSVRVFDVAGNVSVYGPADLEALGLPIGFSITDQDVLPSLEVDSVSVADAISLSLTSLAPLSPHGLLDMVLRLDAPGAAAPAASLSVPGAIDAVATPEGGAQILRIAADLTSGAVSGAEILRIALPAFDAVTTVSTTIARLAFAEEILLASTPEAFVVGTSGNDVISLETEGARIVHTGAGTDRVFGSAEAEEFHGGSGQDWFFAEGGDDVLYGGGASDVLDAGGGDDIVHGGDAHDRLFGRSGNDSLFGDGGDDFVSGHTGDDILLGGAGHDTLRGGQGDDTIRGGTGDDLILGRRDADALYGNAGNDVLDGGGGDDILSGEEGADRFVFTLCRWEDGFGDDVVTDFELGIDTLELPGLALGLAATSSDLLDTYGTVTANGVTIDLGAGQVEVLGVFSLTDLAADTSLF